jgi:hypothetical protein
MKARAVVLAAFAVLLAAGLTACGGSVKSGAGGTPAAVERSSTQYWATPQIISNCKWLRTVRRFTSKPAQACSAALSR